MITLATYRWGDNAGLLVAVLGIIACYCPVHTFLAGFSRLVYAQARDGSFPAWFARLHPRFQTPHRALLTFIPVVLFILLLSYLFSLDLQSLINIPSANFLAVYVLGMSAAAKIFTSQRQKTLAVVSALLSLTIFAFSGWFVLYPFGISLLVLLRQYQRRKNSV